MDEKLQREFRALERSLGERIEYRTFLEDQLKTLGLLENQLEYKMHNWMVVPYEYEVTKSGYHEQARRVGESMAIVDREISQLRMQCESLKERIELSKIPQAE